MKRHTSKNTSRTVGPEGECTMEWGVQGWVLVEDRCVYPHVPPRDEDLPYGSYLGEQAVFPCILPYRPSSDATGECIMEWDGVQWNLIEDNCIEPHIPPMEGDLPDGTYIGEQQPFPCVLPCPRLNSLQSTGGCTMEWNGETWELVDNNCVYPHVPPDPNDLPLGSYLGEQGTFACVLPYAAPMQSNRQHSLQQNRSAHYYLEGQNAPNSEYPPLAKLNLIYHVHPDASNDAWLCNIRELKKRLSIFNGRKIVAIATGPGLTDAEQVERAIDWPDIEYLPIPNDPEIGQTASFAALLTAVRSRDPHEATFYGHTKGTANTCRDARAIAYWRDAMYASLLNDPGMVTHALQHFAVVGTFKKVHRGGAIFPSQLCWSRWHFSGTYFWFRHDRIFGDFRWPFIPHDYYGVEAWLGGFLAPEEAWSLLQPRSENDSTWDGYNPKTWMNSSRTPQITGSEGSGNETSECCLSVVIPCKGRLSHLRQTLPYWLEQETPPHEIIVVDYGCPEHCGDWVESNLPNVRLVRATNNATLYNGSRARNIGASAATGNYLAFADADFVAPPDYLTRVHGQIQAGNTLVQIAHYDSGKMGVNGTCTVSAELFHRIRGYDESSSTYGFDDIEFYGRCQATGTSIGHLHNCQCLSHSDEDRLRFYPDRDKEEAIRKAGVWMADTSRSVNPAGYGQL